MATSQPRYEYPIGAAIMTALLRYGPDWYNMVTIVYVAGSGYLINIAHRPPLFNY